ncbi:carbohydrate ABC transporter permease [Actinomyces ruminicola]|uniref:Multiple sugar transport system permease protein n=1 Tax=Actinomyces ruminicola TaxID=332524 RepID=A0A1G9RS78_9ACTO|nr:carbohydrate ABC transporter permease [Actinomyces ruminicola]SDM25930.1 multiple sugar transport system permease protein [Actinomyces ruminicola]
MSGARVARPGRRRMRTVSRTVTYLLLAAATILMVAPWVWALSTSFKRSQDVFSPESGIIPAPFSLQAYERIFTETPFGTYAMNSVIVTACVVALNVLFDSCAAYAFAKLRFPGRDVLFWLLMITMMIPMQVNLIPLYRMMVWAHRYFPWFGVDTLAGIIAPGVVQVFGIFLMRQFFMSIPDSMLEAARLDGASEFQILRRIVLPIAAPGLATLTIFTFLGTWNDFLWPLLVSSSESTRTLPVGLALLARKNSVDWPGTMAGAVVSAVPMVIVFLLAQRKFIDGLTAGSTKE